MRTFFDDPEGCNPDGVRRPPDHCPAHAAGHGVLHVTNRRGITWTGGARSRVAGNAVRSDAFTPLSALSELPNVTEPLRKVLLECGTPGLEGVSAKEEAIELLKLAAEIEHALMVQYLYAALSVPPTGPNTKAWTTLMTIAEQEMGHLISVQNLLLAIGGSAAFHFGRDRIRVTNPENPMPFMLERVSSTALAKYLAVEMPAEVPASLKARVEPLVKIAEEEGAKPHSVGALYAKLFWLFQPDDEPHQPLGLEPSAPAGLLAKRHLKSSDFIGQAERERFQATRGDWVRGSVSEFILGDSIGDAKSALGLISEISKQGEGLEGQDASHFEGFLALSEALVSGAVPVVELPSTPVASLPPPLDARSSTPIANVYARAWAELFDIRYGLLVLDLWHAMATERGDARSALITLAYESMSLVKHIAMHIIRRRAANGAEDGAPPFGLADDGLPTDSHARWQKHARLLDTQAEITARIQSSPEFSNAVGDPLDFEGFLLIDDIMSKDATRRKMIQDGLQGA